MQVFYIAAAGTIVQVMSSHVKSCFTVMDVCLVSCATLLHTCTINVYS